LFQFQDRKSISQRIKRGFGIFNRNSIEENKSTLTYNGLKSLKVRTNFVDDTDFLTNPKDKKNFILANKFKYLDQKYVPLLQKNVNSLMSTVSVSVSGGKKLCGGTKSLESKSSNTQDKLHQNSKKQTTSK
jgi:hypothetical protein